MDGTGDILVIKGGIGQSVLETTKRKIIDGQRSNDLYLVLNTPGGDASVGFRTMCLLNKKYKNIYVVVPDWAMSTGTLMALGGDVIYMFYSSSLGPLDLQIENPNDGSGISTIDVRDTWTTIMSITDYVATSTFSKAISEYDLPKIKAAQLASEHSINFVKPIIDKIDPYHLQASYRSSAVGAKYAATLLKARMLKLSPFQADKIGKRLADQYETHGIAITLEEARDEMGLNIEDIANLSVWKEIEPIYNRAIDGVQLAYLKKPQAKTMTKEAPTAQEKKGSHE